jgi:ribosomal-protein-alanine N-acetyltransferase
MTQIRRGTDADIDDLLVIEDECFSVYYYGQDKFGVEEFDYYLHGSNRVLFVAESGGHGVGYTAAVVRRPRAELLAHIDSIGVLLDHRNQGIGGQLLQAVIEEAKRRDCEVVALEVATPNEAGIAFFKSHDFHEVRKLPNYYGRGLDGILMTAEL